MNTPTDEQLLADHLLQKPRAFDLLVRRHSRELYQFVLRFTGSSAAADDVVQDAFLQVHLSGASFDPKRRFKPWLFAIAANKARDMLRKRSRRDEVSLDAHISGEGEGGQRFVDLLASDPQDDTGHLELEEQKRIIERTIEQMPGHLREALVLAYYHRFPYKDMAAVLEIPVGTVKSRLHSAVAHFGKLYRDVVAEQEESDVEKS